MDDYFDELGPKANGIFAGIIFDEDNVLNYELRTLYSDSALTGSLLSGVEDCRTGSTECPAEVYLSNGFLELQNAIDSVLLTFGNIEAPQYQVQKMPKENFSGDSSYIRAFAPIYYVLTYSFFIQVFISCLSFIN